MAIRDEKQIRFIQDLSVQYPMEGANRHAHSLFTAISRAFTESSRKKWGEQVIIDPNLVSFLADCPIIAMNYDKDATIPWDASEGDHVLTRVLRAFMTTLRNAILDNRAIEVDGKIYHGCFQIPQWFYDECRTALMAYSR